MQTIENTHKYTHHCLTSGRARATHLHRLAVFRTDEPKKKVDVIHNMRIKHCPLVGRLA